MCRNPDKKATIWCYTTDAKKKWEFCDPLIDGIWVPEFKKPEVVPEKPKLTPKVTKTPEPKVDNSTPAEELEGQEQITGKDKDSDYRGS